MRVCSKDHHQARCRKDRPLCRWRRASYASVKFGTRGPCYCNAYHFPHRPGAGDCSSRVGGGGMPLELRETEAEYRERKRWTL